jgi:hypothetical protein
LRTDGEMSYEESLKSITLVADATVGVYTGVPGQPGSPAPHGGKQYCFVKVTGVATCGLATAGGLPVIGVLQNKPQGTGHAATVGYSGVTNVLTGTGAIVAGDGIKVDGTGRAIKATVTTDDAIVVAIALGTSTGADQLIPALLV